MKTNKSDDRNINRAAANSEAQGKGKAQSAAQLASYKWTGKLNADFDDTKDKSQWGNIRTKLGVAKGGDADSSIASSVNTSLTTLKINGDSLMSAHQIPNRIGGQGTAANVRPWRRTFEDGGWKSKIEDPFDASFVGAKKNQEFTYSVDTTDMSDEAAKKIVDDAVSTNSLTMEDSEKTDHKNKIKTIPLDVTASAGKKGSESSLGKTDEPIKGALK